CGEGYDQVGQPDEQQHTTTATEQVGTDRIAQVDQNAAGHDTARQQQPGDQQQTARDARAEDGADGRHVEGDLQYPYEQGGCRRRQGEVLIGGPFLVRGGDRSGLRRHWSIGELGGCGTPAT